MPIELTQESQSVHLRHIDVADDQVDFFVPQKIQGFMSVGHAGDIVTFLGEKLAQADSGIFLVIHDKYVLD
jgi:hypothetical protein